MKNQPTNKTKRIKKKGIKGEDFKIFSRFLIDHEWLLYLTHKAKRIKNENGSGERASRFTCEGARQGSYRRLEGDSSAGKIVLTGFLLQSYQSSKTLFNGFFQKPKPNIILLPLQQINFIPF